MVHTETKDGEWSEHGTDAFEAMMDMCGIETVGDRCKAIQGSNEISKAELTTWCQEIEMPQAACKMIGRQAWRWMAPQVKDKIKVLVNKLSAKAAASQIGVSEKEVTAWSTAADGDRASDKTLKQHISKVVKWLEANVDKQGGHAKGKRPAAGSPNAEPAKRQQRQRPS